MDISALDGHSIAEQLHTNRIQHNDVLKSIFRFPWESGSFRGRQVPAGARDMGWDSCGRGWVPVLCSMDLF